MSTTKSSSSQVTYERQQTQNTGLANTENRVLPRFSGITETPKHDNEFSNDHAENEGLFFSYRSVNCYLK